MRSGRLPYSPEPVRRGDLPAERNGRQVGFKKSNRR